jgi:hypothetical protein
MHFFWATQAMNTFFCSSFNCFVNPSSQTCLVHGSALGAAPLCALAVGPVCTMAMAARTAQSQIISLDMPHSVPKYYSVQSAVIIQAAEAELRVAEGGIPRSA